MGSFGSRSGFAAGTGPKGREKRLCGLEEFRERWEIFAWLDAGIDPDFHRYIFILVLVEIGQPVRFGKPEIPPADRGFDVGMTDPFGEILVRLTPQIIGGTAQKEGDPVLGERFSLSEMEGDPQTGQRAGEVRTCFRVEQRDRNRQVSGRLSFGVRQKEVGKTRGDFPFPCGVGRLHQNLVGNADRFVFPLFGKDRAEFVEIILFRFGRLYEGDDSSLICSELLEDLFLQPVQVGGAEKDDRLVGTDFAVLFRSLPFGLLFAESVLFEETAELFLDVAEDLPADNFLRNLFLCDVFTRRGEIKPFRGDLVVESGNETRVLDFPREIPFRKIREKSVGVFLSERFAPEQQFGRPAGKGSQGDVKLFGKRSDRHGGGGEPFGVETAVIDPLPDFPRENLFETAFRQTRGEDEEKRGKVQFARNNGVQAVALDNPANGAPNKRELPVNENTVHENLRQQSGFYSSFPKPRTGGGASSRRGKESVQSRRSTGRC